MSISIVVRGNLGQSFELKEINRSDGETSTVLNFSIASNRFKRQKVDGQDRYVAAGPTEWLECEYWNRRAAHLHSLLVKGMPVVVEGEELSETYEKDSQNPRGKHIPQSQFRTHRIHYPESVTYIGSGCSCGR